MIQVLALLWVWLWVWPYIGQWSGFYGVIVIADGGSEEPFYSEVLGGAGFGIAGLIVVGGTAPSFVWCPPVAGIVGRITLSFINYSSMLK